MGSPPHPARLAVPICWTHSQRSWPKHAEAKRVRYASLACALTERYPYDAHTAAYSVLGWPYRLSSGALRPESKPRLPDGVSMALALFDVDCPVSHRASGGSGEIASDAWWQAELQKLEVLAQAHPKPFAYRSRGGYRLLCLLPEPNILREPTDREVWSAGYLTWCAYLARSFDIQADPSCCDWTRLFRLPHSTREEGGHPEEWETWGDPRRIGVWTCTPTFEDMALAQTLSRRKGTPDGSQRRVRSWVSASQGTGEGVLYHAFKLRGWVGQEIEVGKFSAVCPWEDIHTKGERFDTSTILFAPGPGDSLGWWFCSHSHCQHRDLRDILALLSPAELDRARAAAGLITMTAQGLRLAHARGHLRTVGAEEVLAWRR